MVDLHEINLETKVKFLNFALTRQLRDRPNRTPMSLNQCYAGNEPIFLDPTEQSLGPDSSVAWAGNTPWYMERCRLGTTLR